MAGSFVRIRVTPESLAASDQRLRDSRAMTMTEEEVDAARRSDPDALPPMTDEEIDAAKAAPIRAVREATGMTQAAFSAAYGIPLGTLRDWEQGKTTPDATARAYLKAIRKDPKAVLALVA